MTALVALAVGIVPVLVLVRLRSERVRLDDDPLRGLARAHERVVRKDWT